MLAAHTKPGSSCARTTFGESYLTFFVAPRRRKRAPARKKGGSEASSPVQKASGELVAVGARNSGNGQQIRASVHSYSDRPATVSRKLEHARMVAGEGAHTGRLVP